MTDTTHFAADERKHPTEWEQIFNLTIVDPDGWDRMNFDASWAELLTEDEFNMRMARSSIRFGAPEKKVSFTDEQETALTEVVNAWGRLTTASTSTNGLRPAVNALGDATEKFVATFSDDIIPIANAAHEADNFQFEKQATLILDEKLSGHNRVVADLLIASYEMDDAEGFFKLYSAAELFEHFLGNVELLSSVIRPLSN